jgi:hypothetical protein
MAMLSAFSLLVSPRQPSGNREFSLASVRGRGLPAQAGKLACARDRDDSGRLAAALSEMDPALNFENPAQAAEIVLFADLLGEPQAPLGPTLPSRLGSASRPLRQLTVGACG